MSTTNRGFSLGELLVTMGLLATAILALLGLSILIAQADREGVDTRVAAVVASSLVEKLVDQVRADSPTGTAANFWDNDHVGTPWESGVVTNNGTQYQYRILARTVRDSVGDPVGGTAGDTAQSHLVRYCS